MTLPDPARRLPTVVRRRGQPQRSVSNGPSEPVQQVLGRLEGVAESGSGWIALCPAHVDTNPSLTVAEGDNGRALLHCFAGCEPEAVVEAVDLRMADLFLDDVDDASDDSEAPQKVRLVQLAEGHAEFFRDQHDRPFAWIQQDDHRELWPLRGERFRYWLYGQYYEEMGNVPDSGAVTNALGVLGFRAYSAEARDLSNRFARDAGDLAYDLRDDLWRIIRITKSGWKVDSNPQPIFRRFAHQKEQVEPAGGSDLRELLRPFLAMVNEDERLLLLVSIVAALFPDVPRAVLILHGPQGSAKTTLAKIFRAITDPSSTPIPRAPDRSEELAQLLDHHAVLCLDNLSGLDARTSDTLCRAVTGEGFSKRELYTNEEDILFQYQRQIVLNGINIPARRADLLDRSILISTERIPPGDRMEEQTLWDEFNRRRSRIFGAVLDTLAGAMRLEADVKLRELPRMADWARKGYAIAEVLGFGGDAFLRAYRENRQDQNREALESHPVGAALVAFMSDREHWEGAPSKLLALLEGVAAELRISTRQRLWPGSPDWLTRRIHELETNLREEGIAVVEGPRNRDTRTIVLERRGRQLELGETDKS